MKSTRAVPARRGRLAWLQITVLSVLTTLACLSFIAIEDLRARRADEYERSLLRRARTQAEARQIEDLLQINNALKAFLRSSIRERSALVAQLAKGAGTK